MNRLLRAFQGLVASRFSQPNAPQQTKPPSVEGRMLTRTLHPESGPATIGLRFVAEYNSGGVYLIKPHSYEKTSTLQPLHRGGLVLVDGGWTLRKVLPAVAVATADKIAAKIAEQEAKRLAMCTASGRKIWFPEQESRPATPAKAPVAAPAASLV